MPNGGHNPCCGNCIHYQDTETDRKMKCAKHVFFMPSMDLLDIICKDWHQDGKRRRNSANLPTLKEGVLYYYHYSCIQFAELERFENINNPINTIVLQNDKIFHWCGLLMRGTAEHFPSDGNDVTIEIEGSDYTFSIDSRTTFQEVSRTQTSEGIMTSQLFLPLKFNYLHSKGHPYIIYDWMIKHYNLWMPREFSNKKDFRYALFEVPLPNERYRFIPVAPEARLW